MKSARVIWAFFLAVMLIAGCRRDILPSRPTPPPPPPEVPEDPSLEPEDPKQYGTIPCILIEFKDVRFNDPDAVQYYDNILNGDGGVAEYYAFNSFGVFVPKFDVYGPVTLDRNRAYYGSDVIENGVRTDIRPDAALAEALYKVNEEYDVDFAKYDIDSDGVVDRVMFIYAGHDQSQGAPQEAIWSHQWFLKRSHNVNLSYLVFDGVTFDSYFCGPQYKGSGGIIRSESAIYAHELAHSLGLPDFYGKAEEDLLNFSLMCRGMFNDDGSTPPNFNAEEKIMLGWMDRDSNLYEFKPGWQVIKPLQQKVAYVIKTQTEGEYFIVEYRNSEGWDAPLPKGMIVYHVDRSAPYSSRWENWRDPNMGVNDIFSHPCFYISNEVLPGLSNISAVEPVSWDGTPVGCQLTNIEITEEGLKVYAQFDCGRNVNGFVRNINGIPVPDATILLNEMQAASAQDGHFMIEVADDAKGPFTLTVSAPGYRDFVTAVNLEENRVVSVPVTLKLLTEAEDFTLSKYNNNLTRGYYSKTGIGAVKFSQEDLAAYTGCILREVVFYPYLKTSFGGEVYVTVDVDTERVLTKKVENLSFGEYFRNTVDLSGEGIVIPEGKDVYIGYGSPDNGEGSFFVGTVYPGESDNSYWSPFSMESSSWSPMYVERAGITMNLAMEIVVSKIVDNQ